MSKYYRHQNTNKACKETVDKFKSQNIEMNFLKDELTKIKSSSVSSNTDGKIFSTKSDETLSTNVVDKCTVEKKKLEQMNQNSLTELERIKKEEFLMNVEIASLKKELQMKTFEVQNPKIQGV